MKSYRVWLSPDISVELYAPSDQPKTAAETDQDAQERREIMDRLVGETKESKDEPRRND